MKEIADKYKKAWELYLINLLKSTGVKGNLESMKSSQHLMSFNHHFGYLVLEFFPEHKIEIERVCVTYKSGICNNLKYRVYKRGSYVWFYRTAQEAIEKAFEILEKRLEEK